MSKDYREGYSKGFMDGFEMARNNPSMVFPNVPNPIKPSPDLNPNLYVCTKCGVNWEKAGAMGYVCPRMDCYSAIRSVGGEPYI